MNDVLSFGQKLADKVSRMLGSWTFIIIQSVLILSWIVLNIWTLKQPVDPFPFILLNLMLSLQAAYSAPVIMISQNRLAQLDRQIAGKDLEISIKTEAEIAQLMSKIAEAKLMTEELIALVEGAKGLKASEESKVPLT